MNTIQSEWETFREQVMPKSLTAAQLGEVRRVFYAGAESMFRLQYNIGGLHEEAALAVMEGLVAEMEAFAQDVKEGRA